MNEPVNQPATQDRVDAAKVVAVTAGEAPQVRHVQDQKTVGNEGAPKVDVK